MANENKWLRMHTFDNCIASRKTCAQNLLIGVLILGLLCGVFTIGAQAQDQDVQMSVLIVRPGEGETFYAGESSLVYSMQVIGYVSLNESFPHEEMDRVDVRLQVWQSGQMIDELSNNPTKDGRFTFALTVNPENSLGGFPPEYEPACIVCHYSASNSLPSGDLILRVIASHAMAGQSIDERRVFVDRSDILRVPIKVVSADDPQKGVPNIPVQATTRLYAWRARTFLAETDSDGMAYLPLERLLGAPTEYIIRVDPVIVDGIQYTSTGNAELTLKHPKATVETVQLRITSETGSIHGKVNFQNPKRGDDVVVKLIHLPEGSFREAKIDAAGMFKFDSLLLDQYLVMVDQVDKDARDAWVSAPPINSLAYLNLADALHPAVELTVSGITNAIRGSVKYGDMLLPFAWVKLQDHGESQAVDPSSGRFKLHEAKPGKDTLVVAAPGFYSRAVAVNSDDWKAILEPIELKPNESTSSISWGTGEILIPVESKVERGSSLNLQSGWLFGCGGGEQAINILVGKFSIDLQDGCFGLEYLPGESAWFFLFEGAAEINHTDINTTEAISGNKMINLDSNREFLSVDYNPQIVSVLRGLHQRNPITVWEPTLISRVRDMLAWLGVGIAQVLTYIIYLAMLSILVAIPIVYINRWRYNRNLEKTGRINHDEEVK